MLQSHSGNRVSVSSDGVSVLVSESGIGTLLFLKAVPVGMGLALAGSFDSIGQLNVRRFRSLR